MSFLSDGFAAESAFGPSAEGDKIKLMSVVLFLKGLNSFLETFKCKKCVIKVCSLLPESGVFFRYEGEKMRICCCGSSGARRRSLLS